MKYETTRVYEAVTSNIKRVNLLRGGTRSTKSFSLTQMAVRWLLYGKIGNQVINEGDFFILRESFPALRRTVLKDFINILSHEGLMPYVNHVKTTNEFKRKKRTVSFFSADDESKIHGPQNSIFWINEATAVKETVFNQLIYRCSHFCFLDYNPIDPDSWIRNALEEYRMQRTNDVSLDVSTVHDNPFLSKDQMNEILNIQDAELRDVYLKGNWTKLTGLVFPDFEVVESLPEVFDKRYFAIDFGWVDPFVLLEFRQIAKDVYIHEHIYESQFDYNELYKYPIFNMRGCADSADPRSINSLRNNGLKVKAIKKPCIIESIRKVREHNLFITKESENVLKEIKTYKRQKDKNDNIIEEPCPGNDHAMDCLRYGITQFSRKGIIKLI